jgi:hypothetical protein
MRRSSSSGVGDDIVARREGLVVCFFVLGRMVEISDAMLIA